MLKLHKTDNGINMETVICDACGHKQEIELAVGHQIIPEDAATLFGISDSPTVTLCLHCSTEIRDWYRGRVSTLTYDSRQQRFRSKLPDEIGKEYQIAYQGFLDYKGKWRKRFK